MPFGFPGFGFGYGMPIFGGFGFMIRLFIIMSIINAVLSFLRSVSDRVSALIADLVTYVGSQALAEHRLTCILCYVQVEDDSDDYDDYDNFRR